MNSFPQLTLVDGCGLNPFQSEQNNITKVIKHEWITTARREKAVHLLRIQSQGESKPTLVAGGEAGEDNSEKE